MPDQERILKDKVKKVQNLLRAREERIVALETENAMLYLKLAQCQGNVKATRSELSHLRRLFEDQGQSKGKLSLAVSTQMKTLKMLQAECSDLKQDVLLLPTKLQAEIKQFQTQVEQFTSAFQMRASKQSMDTEELQGRLLDAEMALDDAMRRANAERTRRRTLHNTLVELRGNIRVHCRARPLLPQLDSGGDPDLLGLPGTPAEQVIHVVDEETLAVSVMPSGGGQVKLKQMEYERVYDHSDDQNTVFGDVAPLLTSLLDGFNVCIMAYGQTGSGKTHTMLGSHAVDSDIGSDKLNADEGIIPKSAREIFKLFEERKAATDSFAVEISVCEIYNNEICDLLASPDQRTKKHNVFSASDGTQEIPTLITKPVSTVQEVMALVHFGMLHRHEDATLVHAHSSRSHLIVQLNVLQTTVQPQPRGFSPDVIQSPIPPSPPSTPTPGRRLLPQISTESVATTSSPKRRSRSPASKGGSGRSKSPGPSAHGSRIPRSQHSSQSHGSGERSRSPSPSQSSSSSSDHVFKPSPATVTIKTKLQLVDLAGSECVGMSGATGTALRETSNINKSLSALADVLQALAEHRQHIPYRNTKLTHMLQDTIGGDAKLLVMLCVSPVQRYITETLQCLGFGSRARQVARGPAKRRRPTTSAALASSGDFSGISSTLRSTLSGSSGNLSPRLLQAQRKQ